MSTGMTNFLACLGVWAICVGGSLQPALAGEYPELDGRTIRVVIGSPAGETTDTLARAYFKSLERELPDATIRIQNIAGGKALKELAAASESTVTLAVSNRTAIYKQLIKPDDSLDLTKVDWVASLAQANRLLAIRKTMQATTAQALLKMEGQPKFGALAFDSSAFEPLLVNALTGFRFRIVQGMSEGERHAMMLNGELDGRSGARFELQPLFDDGELVPFLKLKKDGYPPAFDSVPALADFVMPDSDSVVLSTIETLDRSAGLLIASAKMSDTGRLESLRRAAAAAANSPDFLKVAEANGFAIRFTDGIKLAHDLQPIVDEGSGIGAKIRAAIECGQRKSETGRPTCK